MDEVKTRTIVVNSDGGWDFRGLLWCHALDLYPLDSGVDMFDTVARDDAQLGRDNRNYRSVIGNFPEDFSTEGDTLREEISDAVATLSSSGHRKTYLCVALILSRGDFEALAHVKDIDTAPISQNAKRGLGALMAAMDAVEAQGDADDTNVIGRMSTRVWFTLIVRDAGASKADQRNGERVLNLIKRKTTGLQTVFFLSEGRQQDTNHKAPHHHFTKLRLLVDVFSQTHTDEVQKNFRAASRRSIGSASEQLIWVRRNSSEDEWLTEPDLLRRELIRRYRASVDPENATVSDEWKHQFDTLTTEVTTMLPGAKAANAANGTDDETDPYTEETALNAVVTAARNVKPRNAEDADKGLDAERQMSDIPARLVKRRFDWLFSQNRIRKIETITSEYEAALTQARDVFNVSLSAELESLRDYHETRRLELTAALERFKMPTTQEARQHLDDYHRDVLDLASASARSEIDAARSRLEKTNALAETSWAQAGDERDRAATRLINAENRLLRLGSALTILVAVSVVALLPIITVQLTRNLAGSTVTTSFSDFFGPVMIILGFSLGIAAIFASMTASRLAKQRNAARLALVELMKQHYAELKLSFASLVRIAVNRWRLSLTRAVQTTLAPTNSSRDQDQSAAFIASLENVQTGFAPAPSAFDDKTQAAIDAAFQKQASLSGKIANVLITDRARALPARLHLRPSHFGATEFALETTASVHDQTLALGVVGDE